jgi:hypothetical protein
MPDTPWIADEAQPDKPENLSEPHHFVISAVELML